ncbi:50S ribosomal protein L32 [Desulfuromonas thiophila]|jgi:large subunit ribosomal protein L32|uniref:Large ribosomal subunit protein bL32 n=1 Tax=Desulfuromonas thiophila TaxID=57664 RepID=A0A1G7AJU0_9BACT|nr:50S ribosomal protein L32 [Desulfuromonas thiophila]NCC36994.1 50S ribosomal protein L32 [Chloroflexia bacterium]MCK9172206.1 50S ribosomal protein L32 [Desulfuromonas thiophila]MDD3800665.1 50S ribosomal protein L32 [Desulfuromonas thiophila]MDY0398073.1 50S ribosomal protein L32 [Desulfuromonas thiophila]SDE14990.1 LSU ribosomal protein L32P [Desulfuromonas thiophila]
MAVPKGKTSKAKRDSRRAHDALSAPGLSVCPQCDEPTQPHRACASCGFYKGRDVLGNAN